MEHHATNQLDVIVNHLPSHRVTARKPRMAVDGLVAFDLHKILGHSKFAIKVGRRHLDTLVFLEAARRVFHNRERLGQNLGQAGLDFLGYFLFEPIDLLEVLLFQRHSGVSSLGGFLQFGNFRLVAANGIADFLLQTLSVGAQLVVAQFLNRRIDRLDLLQNRSDFLHVFLRFAAKNFGQDTIYN